MIGAEEVAPVAVTFTKAAPPALINAVVNAPSRCWGVGVVETPGVI